MNRAQRLALLAGSLTCAGAVYACTSSTATPTPPVNEDAGQGDSGPVIGTDSGEDGQVITPTPEAGSDAGVSCDSLPGTKIYIESADTQQALLDNVGRQLRDNANVTIIFELTGSCTVTPNMYGTGSGPIALPANTAMLYIPSTAENATWAPGTPENTCTTSAAQVPDLGIAALFPSSCAGYSSLPQGNMTQFIGPTQAYTFIVPDAEFANQTSITAWEAYYAFGDGASNPVTYGGSSTAEWNDPTNFFLRPSTKSTLVSTALNIGLTPKQMTDVTADGGTNDGRQLVASSTGLLADVEKATSAQAIGILGDEVYDANRGKGVHVLAFQDTIHGQNSAYFPDSTQTSFDKQNIRDGHYTLWSPDVYMAPATAGVPTNPAVANLLDIILGNPTSAADGGADGGATIDGLAITAKVGLTPSCAMQVTRASDGAGLTAYSPAAPCTCKFLSDIATATLPASCTTCTKSSDCTATGTLGCFNGFCESPPVVLASDGGPSCDNASIVNACTNADTVSKQVNYPTTDGGLLPVTQ